MFISVGLRAQEPQLPPSGYDEALEITYRGVDLLEGMVDAACTAYASQCDGHSLGDNSLVQFSDREKYRPIHRLTKIYAVSGSVLRSVS